MLNELVLAVAMVGGEGTHEVRHVAPPPIEHVRTWRCVLRSNETWNCRWVMAPKQRPHHGHGQHGHGGHGQTGSGRDTDRDGVPNRYDPDDDNDGILDWREQRAFERDRYYDAVSRREWEQRGQPGSRWRWNDHRGRWIWQSH